MTGGPFRPDRGRVCGRRVEVVAGSAFAALGLVIAGVVVGSGDHAQLQIAPRLHFLGGASQHIFIVRHGDKYSSYPACPGQGGTTAEGRLCFDEVLMGDNPPLTDCGIKQANVTARWLQREGSIRNLVVSPYTRTLQTALPLAEALALNLQVEYAVSEANQPDGPFREFNVNAPGVTVSQLEKIHRLWDLGYGSVPIKTPENNTLYVERVKEAAKVLKQRFPPATGDLAVFTHATTSFSVAYGLCFCDSGSDSQLEDFVKRQAAIGPGGVIEVVIGADGTCSGVKQTNNVADSAGCGETPPVKCDFDRYPSWYWSHSSGKGPGQCH